MLVDGKGSGRGQYLPLLQDRYIRAYAQLLRLARSSSQRFMPLTSTARATVTARRVFDDATSRPVNTASIRERLEPLLLCPELGYAEIGRLVSLDVDTIMAYERIYFNVRDEQGKLAGGPWLREHFANAGILPASTMAETLDEEKKKARTKTSRNVSELCYWKQIALEGGHRLLFQHWHWPLTEVTTTEVDFSNLKRSVFFTLEQYVRRGIFRPAELVLLYTTLQASDNDKDGATDASRALMAIFNRVVAPLKPATYVPTDEEQLAKADELRDRVESLKQASTESSMVADVALRETAPVPAS